MHRTVRSPRSDTKDKDVIIVFPYKFNAFFINNAKNCKNFGHNKLTNYYEIKEP